MSRTVISTPSAPSAIGPYSQAIKASGNMLFVSGQIPLDPVTMQMVGDDVDVQTDQVLRNLKAVLEAGGSSLERVVKTTILLRNMADFPKVNEIYGRYFPENPPARATFAVAGLPKDAKVEIECVALVD
eukprot:CAMPEP_0177660006 /NCGR_PEP_ID=MMETSP0447-20121125/17768_1 /TAXON_ID=0 /ORGANISM="Stygamoeba regulata, Strain BSH-02190019" /LENGTH=128 /DNA_ID=CAMNT_0019164959 /DNA_START=50 /DNA_END=436 /DNA_ORIENTATION=+